MKIAVATSDGVTINEHFGQSKSFHIYELSGDGSFDRKEVRTITHAPSDPARAHAADLAVEQLADVDVVLAQQIGQGAVASLQSRGIKAFALKGAIDRALTAYGKRHRLLEVHIPGYPGRGGQGGHSCGCSKKRCS